MLERIAGIIREQLNLDNVEIMNRENGLFCRKTGSPF